MKIYTKTGDLGTTSLPDGSRVSKSNCNINLYGNIDELNSWIGLIRSELSNKRYYVDNKTFINTYINFYILEKIQSDLFNIGTLLSCKDSEMYANMPQILESDINSLEEQIDLLSSCLPVLKNFILPGGTRVTSEIHLARTTCRKAEREVVRYFTEEDQLTKEEAILIIKYLNRLSDYLFVLARFNCLRLERKKEIIWKPNKS